jgi:hypothetical protein
MKWKINKIWKKGRKWDKIILGWFGIRYLHPPETALRAIQYALISSVDDFYNTNDLYL